MKPKQIELTYSKKRRRRRRNFHTINPEVGEQEVTGETEYAIRHKGEF